MSSYRKGTVLGLTVAEIFILITFVLLMVLLGFVHSEDSVDEEEIEDDVPKVWVRPEQIETLVNEAEQARIAQQRAESARQTAEGKLEESNRELDAAKEAQTTAESERDEALNALELADRERVRVEVLRRKGENPPCWYKVLNTPDGKTRERPYYAFNVGIFEDCIVLDRRQINAPPPGGALDDGVDSYANEWRELGIDDLPYDQALTDGQFIQAVEELVEKGKTQQVRTYECVFAVMVWDKTPGHAKKRWQRVHDQIVEGSFTAYTVQDMEWKGVSQCVAEQ